MAETIETRDTFGRIVEGASGTLVFGAGVDAITGDVAHVGDDYVLVDTEGRSPNSPGSQRHAVPLAAVVYFRYAGE